MDGRRTQKDPGDIMITWPTSFGRCMTIMAFDMEVRICIVLRARCKVDAYKLVPYRDIQHSSGNFF